MFGHFPSSRRSENVRGIRHEGDLLRPNLQHEVDKLWAWIAFDVKFGANQRAKLIHVVTANVSFVGTRVDGDALCAKSLTVNSHLLHIGKVATTSVSQSGYFVDIYT